MLERKTSDLIKVIILRTVRLVGIKMKNYAFFLLEMLPSCHLPDVFFPISAISQSLL